MTVLDSRTIQKPENFAVSQRIDARDERAVKQCVDLYGDFIWVLAKKMTASREQAETATREIFTDIWRYCERAASGTRAIEEKLVALIALRRLVNPSLQYAEHESMASIDTTNEQGAGTDGISKSF